MIILIGNQKGGAGKSTLCLLMANYLALVHGRKVTILDMDYQQSLCGKAEKAKVLGQQEYYEVIPADLKYFPSMLGVLDRNKEEVVLIDLPGKMDDDGLIAVFGSADLILCPFGYDELSVDSTILFAMVLKKINPGAGMVFIPNRVKAGVKYETRTQVERVLSQFGSVLPGLADRIDFQRISTFHIPLILYPVIMPVLDLIFQQYLKMSLASVDVIKDNHNPLP